MNNNQLDFFTPVISKDDQHINFKSITGSYDLTAPLEEKIAFICHESTRTMIKEWANRFPDRDGKIVKQFQESFNSTFWEIYLFALLKASGASFSWKHQSPDFNILLNDQNILIEAVIAESAKGKPSEWEDNPLISGPPDIDQLNMEAIVRLLNAISNKVNRYNNYYKELDHVLGKPFVLAINGFEQPGFFFKADRPMRAILYDDYVHETLSIKSPENHPDGPPSIQMGTVTKGSGAKLELGLFLDDKLSHISAIIHNPIASATKATIMAMKKYPHCPPSDLSRVVTAVYANATGDPCLLEDYNETIFDGLQIYHNPFADHPLNPNNFNFPGVTQYSMPQNQVLIEYISGQNKTIVLRTMNGFVNDAGQKEAKAYIKSVIRERQKLFNS